MIFVNEVSYLVLTYIVLGTFLSLCRLYMCYISYSFRDMLGVVDVCHRDLRKCPSQILLVEGL